MATSRLIPGRALPTIPTRTMDTIYDVIVVGNGMFGAAATRHLSARGSRVVAVGPDEPADWKTHDGVFSSHYDQGRITRVIDADPIWAQCC
jgi:glycine/D-amino acid oxidase-like deaminating enzyme